MDDPRKLADQIEKANLIDKLIEDEEEAVEGYTLALKDFTEEETAKVIKFIIDEELKHIDLLRELKVEYYSKQRS